MRQRGEELERRFHEGPRVDDMVADFFKDVWCVIIITPDARNWREVKNWG